MGDSLHWLQLRWLEEGPSVSHPAIPPSRLMQGNGWKWLAQLQERPRCLFVDFGHVNVIFAVAACESTLQQTLEHMSWNEKHALVSGGGECNAQNSRHDEAHGNWRGNGPVAEWARYDRSLLPQAHRLIPSSFTPCVLHPHHTSHTRVSKAASTSKEKQKHLCLTA